jgi:hypothetical protein
MDEGSIEKSLSIGVDNIDLSINGLIELLKGLPNAERRNLQGTRKQIVKDTE